MKWISPRCSPGSFLWRVSSPVNLSVAPVPCAEIAADKPQLM